MSVQNFPTWYTYQAYAVFLYSQFSFTHKEVANILNISEANARQYYYRGKEQLRKRMASVKPDFE